MGLFDLILLIAVAALALRFYVPWSGPTSGETVKRVDVPLLARLRMHRAPGMLLLAVVIAGVIVHGIHLWSVIVVALALAVAVAMPVRYHLTDEMIRFAWARSRRWTEFGGVGRRRSGARLQGISRSRGMTVWLSDSRGDDEFVLLLRQLVRGAYKGQIGPATRLPQPEAAGDHASARYPIAAAR
jgi:hypothetical protein